MVASVKMKRAQADALQGRPYATALDRIAQKVAKKLDVFEDMKVKTTQTAEKNLYVVISTTKGLCGSFNVNIFRFLSEIVSFEKDDFVVVGKKGAEFTARMGASVVADFSQHKPLVDAVSPIFSLIFDLFKKNTYRSVYLVYNKFISTFRTQPVKMRLFPIQMASDISFQESSERDRQEYMVEPTYKSMMKSLIQDVLREKIKTALRDSEAGEHASRMLAMKNATDSAADIQYNLTLLRNKLRQQGITYELLDMIAAKDSE